MKLQASVRKELRRISAGVLIGSGLMVAAFAAAGRFSPDVLWGALLGDAVAIGNFLYLCLSLQKAVALPNSLMSLPSASNMFTHTPVSICKLFRSSLRRLLLKRTFTVIPFLSLTSSMQIHFYSAAYRRACFRIRDPGGTAAATPLHMPYFTTDGKRIH